MAGAAAGSRQPHRSGFAQKLSELGTFRLSFESLAGIAHLIRCGQLWLDLNCPSGTSVTMNLGESDVGLPAEAPRTPLPIGPLLRLPAGDVEVFDDGQLLAFYHRWVVAVGLSNTVFLVVRDRHPKYVDARRLHEVYGYLKACGCEVLPIDLRCPLNWRLHGTFAAIRCLWAQRFFEEGELLFWPLPLPQNARLTMPLLDFAQSGAEYWAAVALVAGALFGPGQPPEPEMLGHLARLSRQWERGWNAWLAAASEEELTDCARWTRQCERNWARVVCDHLAPNGYQMMPASLAKVL